VQKLPSSPTQVHSLRDAGRSDGSASGGAGEIGVTRTYKLPDDKGSDKNSPSKPPERP